MRIEGITHAKNEKEKEKEIWAYTLIGLTIQSYPWLNSNCNVLEWACIRVILDLKRRLQVHAQHILNSSDYDILL